MSRVLVEVGPSTLRGPNPVDPELVSVALDAIDDEIALVGERAVSVLWLWTELMRVAVGDADTVVLVCPTWWPSGRIERVRHATAVPDVEVIGRTALLQGRTRATVVEMAQELVVVTRPDARAVVVARVGHEVVEKVVAAAGSADPVLIDGIGGPLTDEVLTRLRDNRIEARVVDATAIHPAPPTPDHAVASDVNRPRRTAVLLGVIASTVVVFGAFGLRAGAPRAADVASTLLAEGRVQVMVPAGWPVEHITSGPGSARVQIASPAGDGVALHLTQSVGPPDANLTQTAASLHDALSGESDDVFVDFNPVDTPAGRTAVTYRELRADRHVGWTVLADAGVRIAIGCQSPPGHEDRVRDVCDQAIRSAHAIT